MLFATLALALAAVGVYGVLSYGVSERSAEIGVRMALGARPADVQRLVLGEAGALAGAGIGAGLLAAFAFARLMRSLLHEVGPADPLTFVAVAAVLGGDGAPRRVRPRVPGGAPRARGGAAARVKA